MTAPGTVVHLVWAPLGLAPLERFAASYARWDAGAAHRRLVVYKEFHDPAALAAARRALGELAHDDLLMPERRLDLSAYALVAPREDAPWLYFLNSNSELLDAGWLAKPLAHLTGGGAGIVGATASYEGSASTILGRVLRRRRLLAFPNPHVRTNAFMLETELARSLDWGDPRSKALAWQVESGPRSLTRQVLERGLAALVVGRDGVAYPPERWREADVFRTERQANLLVADNRTREFAEAGPARRRRLQELAWGA